MNSLFINETALHTRPLHPPPFPLLSAPSCLGDGVGGVEELSLFAASSKEPGCS
jgi:hypothetical protein